MLVVGENVKGGLHGAQPSLTTFDSRATSCPVHYRQVYATLLYRWLDGDPVQILGGSYAQLDLLTNVPGGPATPSLPRRRPTRPSRSRTGPPSSASSTPTCCSSRPPAARVAPWVSKLQAGTTTPVDLITTFMTSTAPVNEIHPGAARVPRLLPPRADPRRSWRSRWPCAARPDCAKTCESLIAAPEFRTRNGSLDRRGLRALGVPIRLRDDAEHRQGRGTGRAS